MLVAARIGTMAQSGKQLPYDAEVEYLESNGNQYIDTEFVIAATDRVVVRAFFNASDNLGSRILLGIGNPELWVTTGICRFNNENSCKIKNAIVLDAWNDISIDKDLCIVNTITFNMSLGTFIDNFLSLWLFAGNKSTANGTNGRIASCKIYRSSFLVRDYIPVRVGSIGYMYDRVSGQLFGNQGSGAFIIGQDKTT